jgi:hypothetical protein
MKKIIQKAFGLLIVSSLFGILLLAMTAITAVTIHLVKGLF